MCVSVCLFRTWGNNSNGKRPNKYTECLEAEPHRRQPYADVKLPAPGRNSATIRWDVLKINCFCFYLFFSYPRRYRLICYLLPSHQPEVSTFITHCEVVLRNKMPSAHRWFFNISQFKFLIECDSWIAKQNLRCGLNRDSLSVGSFTRKSSTLSSRHESI